MRRLFHSAGSVVTGDRVAEALMEYAVHLLRHREAEVIGFPVLDDEGRLGRAEMLIGPSTQLLSVPATLPHPDPVDDELLDRLERRRRATGRSIPSEVADAFDRPGARIMTPAGRSGPNLDEDVWGLDRFL